MKIIPIADIENYKPKVPKIPIRSGADYFSDWLEISKGSKEGILGHPTKSWPGFNKAFGGARKELVILTGETGRGKTTFGLNWVKDTLDSNRCVFVVSLENGPVDTIRALGQMATGKWITEVDDKDRGEFGNLLAAWPLYILGTQGMLPERTLATAIEYACLELGVKFIFIDHLEFIAKEIAGRNESYVIDDCVRWLSGFAGNLGATIVLICHPAKRPGGDDTEISFNELKGSSGLKQTAASVLVHHRPEMNRDTTWIRFAKIRAADFSRSTGGRIEFGFNSRNQEYWEKTGELDWGNR